MVKQNKIDINKKYIYRNGSSARILCVDGPKKRFPVVSVNEDGVLFRHLENGECISDRNYDITSIKKYMLDKVTEKYPVGTKFFHIEDKDMIYEVKDAEHILDLYLSDEDDRNNILCGKAVIWDDRRENKNYSYSPYPYLYKNGKWAETVRTHEITVYFFKSKDGKSIIARNDLFLSNNYIAKKEIKFYETEGLYE
jgi:hypothetical protein